MDQPNSDQITNPIADPLVEVVDTDAQSRTVVINATAEGMATVVINRPHRRNAFDAEVIGALHEAFETLEAADGVRVVFVRGAAGTFSAGADLDWMRHASTLTEADNREDAMAMAHMLHRLYTLPHADGRPGGGRGLRRRGRASSPPATWPSPRVTPASPSPKSGSDSWRRRSVPTWCRRSAPRRARALFATGRVFGADEARAFGLVDEVVDGRGRARTPIERPDRPRHARLRAHGGGRVQAPGRACGRP